MDESTKLYMAHTNAMAEAQQEREQSTVNEKEEQAYESGSRMAWLLMLGRCLKHLGADDPETQHAAWIQERELTVRALRDVCADHGDNDWPDNLHLSDVVEKHLHRNIDSKDQPSGREASDLTRSLSVAIGVDPRDFDGEAERIMITIGKGIYWSEEFHEEARALAKRVDSEFNSFMSMNT